MIIKVIPRKRNDSTRSRLRDTIAYILKGEESERVSATAWEGVLSPKTGLVEMEALATLREGDPMYHFVLSWPEQEKPTDDQAIEAGRMAVHALVEAHNRRESRKEYGRILNPFFMQFVMAVHRDTNNVHVHVLLNRRETDTHTLMGVHFDYLALDHVCREIELKCGWSHDNGHYAVGSDGKTIVRSAKNGPKSLSTRASLMEEHEGEKSLQRFVREVVPSILDGATGWEDAVKKLQEHGLSFHPVSGGLLLTDGHVLAKASSCGKAYGRWELEKRWGPIPEFAGIAPREKRREERALLRHNLKEEYREYCRTELVWWTQQRREARQAQRKHEQERKSSFQQEKRRIRKEILSMGWESKGDMMRALLAIHAQEFARKKWEMQKQFESERQAIRQTYSARPFRSWREYCEVQARAGDREAARVLRGFRYRDRRRRESALQIVCPDDVKAVINPGFRFGDFFSLVHSHGQVDYFHHQKPDILVFSDHGRVFHVFEAEEDRVLEAALRIALEKWGRVELRGEQVFQDRMRAVAARMRAVPYVTLTVPVDGPAAKVPDRGIQGEKPENHNSGMKFHV